MHENQNISTLLLISNKYECYSVTQTWHIYVLDQHLTLRLDYFRFASGRLRDAVRRLVISLFH
jgi:hypothetical protein